MGELFGAFQPMFVFGLLFGVAILLSGIVFGVLWTRRFDRPQRAMLEPEKLMNYLGGLMDWTSGFATQLEDYRSEVSRLTGNVDDGEAVIIPPNEVEVMRRFVDANEALQGRLDQAEDKLRHQAMEIAAYVTEARTDSLTGLPNRRVFDTELSRRMFDFRRHGTPLSLVILDIDFFKLFNDSHGHLAGDEVLRRVARAVQNTVHETHIVCRLGGEEFAVVLPATAGDEALAIAESIRTAVANTQVDFEGRVLEVTVSCGSASTLEGDTPDTLIKRADNALYAAKDAGRNRSAHHNGQRCELAIQVEESCQSSAANVADVATSLETNAKLPAAPLPDRQNSASNQVAERVAERVAATFQDACDEMRTRLRSFNGRSHDVPG